jgi:hypothetical protein
VSHPYQPRLFSTALGVLSTDVRPLSSTSKCYARGRASPSPTDGRSPAIQPPLSSSSYHCHHPTTIVIVQLPPSLSSCHRHCPATIVTIQLPPSSSVVKWAMWTGKDTRDTLSHVLDLHGIEGYDPLMVDVSGCHILRASFSPSGSIEPLAFTCFKRVFTDIKAALISLGSPSHSRCPLLVNVKCWFGV